MSHLLTPLIIGCELANLTGTTRVKVDSDYSDLDQKTYVRVVLDDDYSKVIEMNFTMEDLTLSLNAFSDIHLRHIANKYHWDIPYMDGVTHV